MIDRPAPQPLPWPARFVYAEWKKARVNLDYHVELDQHYYSTPYQLVEQGGGCPQYERNGGDLLSGASAWPVMRAIARRIRPRRRLPIDRTRTGSIWSGRRPASSSGRSKVGPFTARLVEGILTSKPHPEMGYRSALGVRSGWSAKVWCCETAGSGLDAGRCG